LLLPASSFSVALVSPRHTFAFGFQRWRKSRLVSDEGRALIAAVREEMILFTYDQSSPVLVAYNDHHSYRRERGHE
jgi:hypothetical protein